MLIHAAIKVCASTHQVVDYVELVIGSVPGVNLLVLFLPHVFLQNMSVFEGLLTVQALETATICYH